MNLTDVEIEENKQEFISRLKEIKRPGDVEGLIKYLEESDFFYAPASAKYHSAFKGGLCAHCLNVHRNLEHLVFDMHNTDKLTSADIPAQDLIESVAIVALLHDISKANFYETFAMNKKVYNEKGTKSDNLGRFDWVSEEAYKVREENNRFIFGTHAQNSERIVSSFLPLYDSEACAIINHHSVYDNPNLNITAIYDRFTLAALLHVADMLATYVDERLS